MKLHVLEYLFKEGCRNTWQNRLMALASAGVLICCLLLTGFSYLVFANVDPEMSYEIVEMLSQINQRGTTVLMVTHAHDLVRHFNRRVITLEKGHIVSDTGAPAVSSRGDRPATVTLGQMADGLGGDAL